MAHQEALGVAVTSRVGQATVLGRCWEIRERSAGTTGSGPETPRHAVVRAPLAAAFAIRWLRGGEPVPDLLVVSGTPPGIVTDLAEGCRILDDLLRSPPSDAPPSPALQRALADELRSRVGLADRTPASVITRRLARLVLRRAAVAGRARRREDVTLLDTVLDELMRGTTAGGERELVSALGSTHAEDALRLWLDRWRTSAEMPPTVRLEAAIFGDGTANESR